jgi:hypothetical protein
LAKGICQSTRLSLLKDEGFGGRRPWEVIFICCPLEDLGNKSDGRLRIGGYQIRVNFREKDIYFETKGHVWTPFFGTCQKIR